jgi:hypothetical protein
VKTREARKRFAGLFLFPMGSLPFALLTQCSAGNDALSQMLAVADRHDAARRGAAGVGAIVGDSGLKIFEIHHPFARQRLDMLLAMLAL